MSQQHTSKPTIPSRPRSFWSALGPGILFAGAAIGNSHLVQSTRAGALFGLGLLGFILFANFIKYPAMRFGPQYAGATGRSLVSGYRHLGRWVVVLFAFSEVAVMAIIVAASALTTAAIITAISPLEIDTRYLGVAVTIIGTIILRLGGYNLLERVAKFFVVILTLTTFASTALALPNIDWSLAGFQPPEFDFATFAFVIALMGFMPATVSLSVLQSLWVVAKSEEQGAPMSFQQCLTDFNIGYIGTVILAVCFLGMGAGVLHPNSVQPQASGGAFAAQIISLYTTNLGAWSGIFVGASAMMVMFTTLVTLLDGFPRTLAACLLTLQEGADGEIPSIDDGPSMIWATAVIVLGASTILVFFTGNFRDFIDFVTITAFIVAPLSAILNHVVITGTTVPQIYRPGPLLRVWSVFGIIALLMISGVYLWLLATS